MREQQNYSIDQATATAIESSAVLRNTYGLLALTLAFSGLVAYISQQMNMPHPGIMLTLVGFYGLFFSNHETA